jgi:hypothetical protein
METILILGYEPLDTFKIGFELAKTLRLKIYRFQKLREETSKKPYCEWEYLDHYNYSLEALKRLNGEKCILLSNLGIHPAKPEEPIVFLIPYPPKPAKVIITVETPVVSVALKLKISEDQAKLRIYNERQWAIKLAEDCEIPLFHVTNSEESLEDIINKIVAFLGTVDSEIPTNIVTPTEGQEIQCSVYESSPDVQSEMKDWLISNGVNPDRIAYSWDTWIGIFLHPPLDEVPWTPAEFIQIYELIKTHPNVMKVDIPEKGRIGMAKSTG